MVWLVDHLGVICLKHLDVVKHLGFVEHLVEQTYVKWYQCPIQLLRWAHPHHGTSLGTRNMVTHWINLNMKKREHKHAKVLA